MRSNVCWTKSFLYRRYIINKFSIFLILHISKLFNSEISTFSPFLSDEIYVPFGFTSSVYETILIDDGSSHQYIIPTNEHMGVPEPFSGNPSGDVVFNILNDDIPNSFQAACKKLGKFFFLHLYASFDRPTNHKKRSYRFRIEAVFTSHNTLSIKPISLRNVTEVVVNILDAQENCPIFPRNVYQFSVPDNASLQETIGKLSASGPSSGVIAQNFFYLDPAEVMTPFRIDLHSGDIFLTRSLTSQSTNFGYPEFMQMESEFDAFGVPNYTFNVFAESRGGHDRIHCNTISVTRVETTIIKSRHSDLVIKVEPFEGINVPGTAGVAYARVHVIDPLSTVNSRVKLKILEPDAKEKFELVPMREKNVWLILVKYDMSSISLSSLVVLTLEAYVVTPTETDEIMSMVSKRLSHLKVSIPVVSKLKYKLSLPAEIRFQVSEAAIVNSTIGVLKPSAPFNLTNASYVFTDLRSQYQKSKLGEKIKLTKSGYLVVVQPLDLDSDPDVQNSFRTSGSSVITIPFNVVDGNNLLLSSASESRIVVEVFDVNNLDPIVQNNGSTYEVPENASVDSLILSIIAYDPDISHTDLSYVLYDNDVLPFSLSGSRHDKLVVSRPLDAETMPSEFVVRVRVTDSGVPLPRSVLAIFFIRIQDINEHSPVFVEDSCEISLPVTEEGSVSLMSGSSTPNLKIGRYFAEDLDRDGQSSITIHIAARSFPRPCFKVDEQTGDLSIICSYLGSPGTQIILNLQASDGSKVSKKSCNLSLNLVPIQIAGTNFTKRCKSSHIYDELQALKVQKRRYEFLLSQNTLYEPQSNRHRPQFPTDLPTRIHIPENLPVGTVILKFAASDEDGADYSMAGQVVYGLEALRSMASETEAPYVTDMDIKQAFLLVPNSGLRREYNKNAATVCCGVSLIVAAPLDREVISSYSLILHACDLGQPQLCTFSPLHIFLSDLDDNAPEFLQQTSVSQAFDVAHIPTNPSLPTPVAQVEQSVVSAHISVPEDVQPDSILGQVGALDRDVTSEIRYHLLNFQDIFKIHSRTGKIRLKTKLDRETQGVYELLVSAVGYPRGNHQVSEFKIPYSDLMQVSRAVDYNARRSVTTRVRVIVTDVNDNPPVFHSPGLPQESHYIYKNLSDVIGLNAWFGTDGYIVYVPEDIPEGAYITTLMATDKDEGMNAFIRYSLFGKQESSATCFHTDQLTGVVRLAAGCDLRKGTRTHILTAWAMDHGASQLYANISFIVHVLSVRFNVFPPRFMNHPALFGGWIRENQPCGSFIYTERSLESKLQLKAVDVEGLNVFYAVVGGSGFGTFRVDDDGFVLSTKEIDAEAVQDDGGFWLVVYAIESLHRSTYLKSNSDSLESLTISSASSGPLHAIAELFIEVIDENDHSPVAQVPHYHCQLFENSPANVVVVHITATDSDKDATNLKYRLTTGDPQGHFIIDINTGILSTTERSLDREAVLKDTGKVELNLGVTISDSEFNPRTTEVFVTVELLDINDNPPEFIYTSPSELASHVMNTENPFYHFQYYTTNSSNSLICVGRVFALDLDSGLNGTVVYERDHSVDFLSSGSDDFLVLRDSGLICTKGGVPPVGEYRMHVFARDQGHPVLRTEKAKSAIVFVRILQPPSSDISSETIEGIHHIRYTSTPPAIHSVDDNTVVGKKMFNFAVHDSYDPSGMGLVFELLTSNHSYHHPFALGYSTPTSLFVYLAEQLDYNSLSVHNLLLIISNGLEMITTKIQINVQKAIHSSPRFSISSITSEPNVSNVSVVDLSLQQNSTIQNCCHHILIHVNLTESTLTGSLVCRLTVNESENDAIHRLHYAIMSVEHSQTWDLFTLNEYTGELRVNGVLDHETIQHHYILATVRYSDVRSYSSYATIYVHVLDTNEYAPQFLGLYTPSNEGTQLISIIDNDSVPQYLGSFTFYTSGLNPINSSVGCVTAFDPDSGENGRIVYNIIKGDTADFFAIEPVTGCITLVKSLLPSYAYSNSGEFISRVNSKHFVRTHRLVVSASDNGTPVSKTNYTQVKIHIVPGPGGIDAPAPRFALNSVLHLSAHENLPPSTVLAPLMRQLTPDSAIPGFITFRLVSSKPMNVLSHSSVASNFSRNLFHVTVDTGLLITSVRLDRETDGEFHLLVVEVIGTGGIRSMFYDRLSIQVRILDVNDNPPKIIGPSRMTGVISEDSSPGTMIVGHCLEDYSISCDTSYIGALILKVTDFDLGINAKLVYTFVGPQAEENDQLFVIDNSTGVLRLSDNALLDRETKGHYILMIEVSDSGKPSLTADRLIRISVEVTDVNDSPPIFTDPYHLQSTLFLPTYPNELILQLKADDPDLNDSVHYYLVGGDGAEHFTIDENDGLLRVAPNSSLSKINIPHSFSSSDQAFFLHVEAIDNHKPIPHISRSNITIFVRSVHTVREPKTLIIDPVDGLNVEVEEHYAGSELLKLGQLSVRNSPVGTIYRFITLTPHSGIYVHPLTGSVFATGKQNATELDRETTKNFTMNILVRDAQNHVGTGVIYVHLLDINDFRPQFIGLPYYVAFCVGSGSSFTSINDRQSSKNVESNRTCKSLNQFKVTAVDKDEGINGTVVYSLTSIRPRAEPPLLSINSTSGHVYLLRNLPSDWTGRQIEAVVAAIDGGGLSSTATVNIHLVAENGPQFSANLYSASILESAAIGEAVTSVEAVGIDIGASLIYRIVNAKSIKVAPTWHGDLFNEFKEQNLIGLENCPFALEFNTGVIRVSDRLDYESSSHYLLLLEVIDTQTSFAARVNLLINITDVNDVQPAFSLHEYSVHIPENVPIGHRILTLKAYDPDSGYGGQIRYSLELYSLHPDSSPHSHFECDPQTGDIFVAKQLDFETVREYLFWAIASDQSSDPLDARVPLHIQILDFNDNPPYFDSSWPRSVPNSSFTDYIHGEDGDGDTSENGLSKCVYYAQLNERSPIGTVILQLSASDPDINDSLSYSIISLHQNETSYFHLGRHDGVLRWIPLVNVFGKPIITTSLNEVIETLDSVSSSLDSSNSVDQLKIKVEVTDGLHSSTCDVIVNLEPSNWDSPRFDLPKYEWWEISELTTVGSIVNRIQPAKDMDRGNYGRIAYDIVGGYGQEWFSIDANDGTIRLAHPLDRETKSQYSLLIRAKDGGDLMDYMKLDISVKDINDNRPVFTQVNYELTLLPSMYSSSMERSFPVTLPLQLKAYDADAEENAHLVYRIFYPPNPMIRRSEVSKRFSIDSTTGTLILNAALSPSIVQDSEEQLLVEACDSPVYADSVVLCSSPVKIHIRYSNQSSIVLPEIACKSRPLLEDDILADRQVGVCDVRPANLSRLWRLTSVLPPPLLSNTRSISDLNNIEQHQQTLFRIESQTGRLYSSKPLNYEIQSAYELIVELHTVMYNVAIIIRTDVKIELIDVNDCSPYFDSSLYRVDIPEDYPLNVKFLRTLAMDDDICLGCSGSGHHDNRNDDIMGTIDKQDIITYSLWPISTLASEHFSLRGSLKDQRARLEKLTLFNHELQALRNQFKIDAQGWISLNTPLDFESGREHVFWVMATDVVGHWNTSRVHIIVRDINDNPPLWPLSPVGNDSFESILSMDLRKRQILSDEIEILENWWPSKEEEIIYQLAIMDPDKEAKSQPRFSLINELPSIASPYTSHENSFYFYVHPSGALYLRRKLDKELSPVYVLRFQASDGLFVTQDQFVLRVIVKDMNDNVPLCLQPNRVITVREDLKLDAILTTLNATDSDVDPRNSLITYTSKFQKSNIFSVDSHKGIVTLNASLDFELSQEHEIIIDASDPDGFSCSFNLRLVVLDVNDNPPVFDNIEISAIPEDAPLGSLVGKINARDLDSVDTNRLVYSLLDAHDASFSIESHTGLLRISRPLDREVKSTHTLTVLVTDGSTQHSGAGNQSVSFTSSATFTIKLLDVNDSPPQFINTSAHRIKISELAHIGERLTRLKAISQDEGDNAVIHYRLLTKQPEFRLNETTGDLWLQKSLDYEQTPAYFLTIEARDRGQPPLSSTAVLTVHVDDENDNRPQFMGRQRIPENIELNKLDGSSSLDSDFYQYYYAFSVVENSRNGTVIGKLNAIDPDSGDNGRVSFHLGEDVDFSALFKAYQQDSAYTEYLTVTEAKTRFTLDSESGRLILAFQPDREVISGYWLAVQVEDHGKPISLSSLTLVHVQILDINDCAPTFEKPSYEFYVEVDRSGNISTCSEKQNSYEVNCQSISGGNVLIGRLRLTDADAYPNSGPFTCQLANSGFMQTVLHDTSSRSGTITTGSALFSVRTMENNQSNSQSNGNDHARNETDFSRGECLVYAVDKLPVGSQSLVIRANDNGLTALHTTTTVTVRVIRMSNLPPEIVNTNSTLIYYHGAYNANIMNNNAGSTASKQEQSIQNKDAVIARVTVKDRTTHDRLFFELINDDTSNSNLFSVDQYDGTIRSAATLSSSDSSSRSSKAGTNSLHYSLIHLDSGIYPLRVRVTNGTLTSEAVIHIKIIAITEEMIDSSLVIRITNLLPNLFYMENYNTLLQSHLSDLLLESRLSHLLPLSSTTSLQNSSQDNVFILSVQETDFPNRHSFPTSPSSSSMFQGNGFNQPRSKRSLDRAVDILVAVYDPKEREYIKPQKVAQAVNGIADRLAAEFDGEIEAIHDVCTPQFCPRGRCHTKVTIDPNGAMNRIEVHRVNQVSPRFILSPVCQCPIHFSGLLCNTPTDACALANCPASRICVPHGLNDYTCICPPPRTGPNCESLLIYGNRDNCHSEACFNQREYGPLQFTGGTFIHWEFVNPNPFYFEIKFSFRTRQTNGPLVSIRWSSIRTFQLRLANSGHLVISPTGLSNGLPTDDWLISAAPFTDGHWHRVRFVLMAVDSNAANPIDALFHNSFFSDDASLQSEKKWSPRYAGSNWWTELTVDGINPQSTLIKWSPGDSHQQGILVGADLVYGFRPLSEPYKLIGVNAAPESNLVSNSSHTKPIVFRSGIVGCFRDFSINRIKPPYQVNLVPEQSKFVFGLSSNPSLLIVRTQKLDYGCQPIATISGSCASGPCLHGGTCVTGSKPSSSVSSYICDCPSLFHGRHCERTNDACLLSPCYNGGSCQTLMTSSISKTPSHSGLAAYRCVCPAGLSGLHCEVVHPEIVSQAFVSSQSTDKRDSTLKPGVACHTAQLILQQDMVNKIQLTTNSNYRYAFSIPSASNINQDSRKLVCLHSGSCLDSPSGPQCICPSGWQGARCEYDVDECRLVKSVYSTHLHESTPYIKWLENRASPNGGLCSPYSPGRGVCFNTPGSYRCNCSIGFSGQHCQSKNLVPLIPDTNPLGLSQFHIYIIVGLLAFLFLAALATIVLLACRARGMIGGTLAGSRRSIKSPGSYWPNGNQQTKPACRSSDPRLNRLSYSAGGSLSGVPFIAASPAHPGHVGHIGTHPRYHIVPTAHRRPSLASSTFGFPVAMDESATALLNSNSGQMPFSSEGVKLGGNCNAAAALTDYADRDDSVTTCNPGLLLYPTAMGDQMPVMMMLSPLPGTHGSVGPGNRASVIARYSPASSVIFYGPGAPSGSATPTNQVQSPQPGFNVDPSGSGYVSQRQCYAGSQVALYPTGHPTFLPHPQSHQQLIQMINMRPNSVVGSDRLSLGSGSDRFSAHSSQVLAQPNSTCAMSYPCCSQSQALTPQLYYHQSSASHHQPWTPHLASNGHTQPNLLIMNQTREDSRSEEAFMTLRPQNTDNVKADDVSKSQSPVKSQPNCETSASELNTTITSTSDNNGEVIKPRPVPASLQHTTSAFVLQGRQHSVRQQNNHVPTAFSMLHAIYPCCPQPFPVSNACCKQSSNNIFPVINHLPNSRYGFNSSLHPGVHQAIPVIRYSPILPFMYSHPSVNLDSMYNYQPIPENAQNSESLFHLPDSCPLLHDSSHQHEVPTCWPSAQNVYLPVRDSLGGLHQSSFATAASSKQQSPLVSSLHAHSYRPLVDKVLGGASSRRTLQFRRGMKAGAIGLPPPASRPHSAHLLGLKFTSMSNNGCISDVICSDAQPNCRIRNSTIGEANGCMNGPWVDDISSSPNHMQNNRTKFDSNLVSTSTHSNELPSNATSNGSGVIQNQIPNKLDWFGNSSGYHPLLRNNTCNSFEVNGNHKESQNVTSDATAEFTQKSLTNGLATTHTKQSSLVNNSCHDTKSISTIDDM